MDIDKIKMNVKVMNDLLDDMTDANITSPLKDFIKSRLNQIDRECNDALMYANIQHQTKGF